MKVKNQNENQMVFAEAAKLRTNIRSSLRQQLDKQIVSGKTVTQVVYGEGKFKSKAKEG